MQTPKVTEITALSAHRRDAALVRRSPAAAPSQHGRSWPGAERLRSLHPSVPPQDRLLRNW
jgi:hypothetical protein